MINNLSMFDQFYRDQLRHIPINQTHKAQLRQRILPSRWMGVGWWLQTLWRPLATTAAVISLFFCAVIVIDPGGVASRSWSAIHFSSVAYVYIQVDLPEHAMIDEVFIADNSNQATLKIKYHQLTDCCRPTIIDFMTTDIFYREITQQHRDVQFDLCIEVGDDVYRCRINQTVQSSGYLQRLKTFFL